MGHSSFIPYGRQIIDADDIQAVVDVLKSDWLTTGPAVEKFESAFAEFVTAPHAVAVSNGTAALHLAMAAAGVTEGVEVIVPAITFVATANAARFLGAEVRFADIDPRTFLISPESVRSLISPKTKAIVAVDYAGMPCDYAELRAIADEHGVTLIADACHAPGARYRGTSIGNVADLTAFSFHPVKHLTTGEGGMITTASPDMAAHMRALRSHGIATDFRQRESAGTWTYDQVELGYNYRISDINCALGLSQLHKQSAWIERRRAIAAQYRTLLAHEERVTVQHEPQDRESSWHLFPVVLSVPDAEATRRKVFDTMRAAGIGVNVHYRPVYLNTYYTSLGYVEGLCPTAELTYAGLLSLPMWPGLQDADIERIVAELCTALDNA